MTDSSSQPSGTGRWLVALLILGLSGWTAFTIYERLTRGAQTTVVGPVSDSRLEAFLAAGHKHLAAGELQAADQEYTKASGVNDADAGVLEGLAMVRLLRAEHTWWNLTFGKHDSTRRVALLRELDAEVDRARQAVLRAADGVKDEAAKSRLAGAEARLNAMLVVALALHGDEERARGAVSSRLGQHAHRRLLEEFIAMVGKSRPETEPPDAGGDAGPGPVAETMSPDPRPKGAPGSPHYEFNEEPTHGMPKTPGELEITVGKERVETVPAPAPPPN